MRILSKTKDYYDYISHRLGADPNCPYLRGKLRETRIWIDGGLPTIDRLLNEKETEGRISLCYVVAGMMVFPMVGRRHKGECRDWYDWYAYDAEKHAGWFSLDTDGEHKAPPTFTEEQVKTLIRTVGAPVFQVRNIAAHWDGKPGLTVSLEEHVPVLKDLGIPALVPAGQMWQNIYTTLTSVLRDDPDKKPPCTLSNEERIWASGLDPKTSFRHPIKLSQLK